MEQEEKRAGGRLLRILVKYSGLMLVLVLMALASYRYNKILFLVEGTAAVLSGLAVLVSDVLYRRNISTTASPTAGLKAP